MNIEQGIKLVSRALVKKWRISRASRNYIIWNICLCRFLIYITYTVWKKI